MSTRTLAVGALVLFFSLGCGSLGEALMKATGTEMNVVSGAEAKHPADFPFPPPPSGRIESVVSGGMAGMKMVTVAYVIEDGGPTDEELLAPYEQILKDKGMNVQKSTQDGTSTVAGQPTDGSATNWSATVTKSDSQRVLALVVVNAAGADAPAQ